MDRSIVLWSITDFILTIIRCVVNTNIYSLLNPVYSIIVTSFYLLYRWTMHLNTSSILVNLLYSLIYLFIIIFGVVIFQFMHGWRSIYDLYELNPICRFYHISINQIQNKFSLKISWTMICCKKWIMDVPGNVSWKYWYSNIDSVHFIPEGVVGREVYL